jgi:pimeloyl-ACP methyl ester carboxylesterase
MKRFRRAPRALGPVLSALLLASWVSAFAPRSEGSAPQGLALSERGQGEPTLVLIHGIGLDRSLWSRVVPKLEQSHRIILVDLPGHGQSPAIQPITVHAVAEALDRSLRERGVKRAVLVGHSYGGLVALEEAVAHPDRARAVISIDIATHVVADSTQIGALEDLISKRYVLFLQAIFPGMTRDSTMVDSILNMASRVISPVLVEYFRDVWHTDLRPRIRSMKQPILVQATDMTWPAQESWSSARKRLGYETAGPATGQRIWNSSHLVPYDQPDTLAAGILGFTTLVSK